MREKHSALMRPVVFALDHVCSITSAAAETPHETWFQQTYGDAINSALERLKNPHNPANPASSWLPFKQVCVRFTKGSKPPRVFVLSPAVYRETHSHACLLIITFMISTHR